MEHGQAPNPDDLHTSAQNGSAPAVAYIPSFRPSHAHGLTASSFFAADVRLHLQALYDMQATLQVIIQTPEFVDETRAYLIDCIEQTIAGQIPPDEQEPTEYTLAALRLYQSLFDGYLDADWPQRMIQAARRDVSRPRCSNWSDLLLYCRYAAEPLGRAVLQLHHIESPEIERAADALTAALLILHLVKRISLDWRCHGRCYLPTDWFAEEGGTPEQLIEPACSPATRRVIDRVLERTEQLLEIAEPLPGIIGNPRLRAEAVRLLTIAHYQQKQLALHDPLAHALKTPLYMRALAHLKGWWSAKRA